MKNKLFKIAFISSLLLPTCIVKADLGAPEVRSADAVVTASNGIKTYDEDGKTCKETIKYGTKINLDFSEKINGELFYYFSPDDIEEYYECQYVKKDGITINTSDFRKDEEAEKLDEPHYLYAMKDTPVYSGPSQVFEKVGTIKAGTKIEVTYEYGDVFGYTETSGVKGWIYFVNGYTALEEDITAVDYANNDYYSESTTLEIYTDDEALDYSEDEESNKPTKITVKKHQKLEVEYYVNDIECHMYYVNVNGTSGWVYSSSVIEMEKTESKLILNSTSYFKIYENIESTKALTNVKLQTNKIYNLNSKSTENKYFEIIIDDKTYLLDASSNELEKDIEYDVIEAEAKLNTAKNIKYYNKYKYDCSVEEDEDASYLGQGCPLKLVTSKGTLPLNTEITIYYPEENNNSLVFADGYGWINANKLEDDIKDYKIYDYKEKTTNSSEDEDLIEETDENVGDLVPDENKEQNKDVVEIPRKTLIIGGVVAAIIIALTAIVTIVLVAKTKKNKNNVVIPVLEETTTPVEEQTTPVKEPAVAVDETNTTNETK